MMKRLVAIIVIFLTPFIIQVKADNYVYTPINVSHGLSDNQIRYILQLQDERMVITTSGNLNLYDGVRFSYIHRLLHHIYPLEKYDGHYRIYYDNDSLLWIKDSHKLMCVDLHQEKYLQDLNAYFRNNGILENVEDLFMDSEQRIWILNSMGLIRLDTLEVLNILGNKGKLQDLSSYDNELYLFYDTGELVCYDLKTKEKMFCKAAYPTEEQAFFQNTSLVVKGNSGIYQLRNGSKGGFFFFDIKKRTWRKILEVDYTLNTLTLSSDETAYISCPNGFWKINCLNGVNRYYPLLKTVEGDIIDTEISTVFCDKQGGLWLGTINRGLLYHHSLRYEFSKIGRSSFPVFSTRDIVVQSFAEDKDGDIYLKCSSNTSLYYLYDKVTNSLVLKSASILPESILNKLNEKYVLQADSYTSRITDSRGWTWIGSEDGLNLIKPEGEKVVFYTENGLSNNSVHAVYEDQNYNIWVTTSYGITKIQVDSVSEDIYFFNYNPYNGTLEDEYADNAVYEAMDGTLYFGGINGFNILKSNRNNSTKTSLNPLFTNLLLHGQKVEVGDIYNGRVILSKTPPYTDEIELSYDQNFLTFEYSALNYINPLQTRYRYRLVGIDSKWRELPTRGSSMYGTLEASYTNLPYGKYLLQVMASNDNQWNGVRSELTIVINPPWWKTSIAYIIYILCMTFILSLSFYLYRYFSQLKRARQRKEEMLLLRIRNLIEQCNLLEEENRINSLEIESIKEIEDGNIQESKDSAFLSRAIKLVEENLNVSTYSVEQLSRDLCMDRTGLYRKLKAILDKSPSLFIRNIRLQRAAQLIMEGKLSITEIAERVGFSSSSYMSKCFQQMYGCRPSEYEEKMKEST